MILCDSQDVKIQELANGVFHTLRCSQAIMIGVSIADSRSVGNGCMAVPILICSHVVAIGVFTVVVGVFTV